MFVLVLLVLVASASAAPRYGDQYDYNNGYQPRTNNFWDNFVQEMNNFKNEMDNDMLNMKNQEWSTNEGNEHKITIYLTGFNKKDIVVKAKKGTVVIQANHYVPGGPSNNFQYVKDLPDFVDENGSWSYNNGALTIFFPIIQLESDKTTESSLPYHVNSVKEKPKENYNQGVIGDGV